MFCNFGQKIAQAQVDNVGRRKYKNTKRWQKDKNTKRWQKDKKVPQRAQVNNVGGIGQMQIEFGRCIPSTTLLAILIKFASFAEFARFTYLSEVILMLLNVLCMDG